MPDHIEVEEFVDRQLEGEYHPELIYCDSWKKESYEAQKGGIQNEGKLEGSVQE